MGRRNRRHNNAMRLGPTGPPGPQGSRGPQGSQGPPGSQFNELLSVRGTVVQIINLSVPGSTGTVDVDLSVTVTPSVGWSRSNGSTTTFVCPATGTYQISMGVSYTLSNLSGPTVVQYENALSIENVTVNNIFENFVDTSSSIVIAGETNSTSFIRNMAQGDLVKIVYSATTHTSPGAFQINVNSIQVTHLDIMRIG